MTQGVDEQGSSEELGKAVRVLRNHGYAVNCDRLLTGQQQEKAELKSQLHALKRRRKLERQYPVDDGGGRAGRPLSVERKVARGFALGGSPYVIALYIAKGIAEHFSPAPDYRRLKLAFDREYKEHGVDPPAAPRRWSRYSLDDVDRAGWPTGWEKGWSPRLICWICGGLVGDVCRRALMNRKFGIEWYTVHSYCGEEMAKQLG